MTLHRLRRNTLLLTILLAVLTVPFMLFIAFSRRMLASDVAAHIAPADQHGYELIREPLQREGAGTDLVIPLPEGSHFEDVRIDNHSCIHQDRSPFLVFGQSGTLRRVKDSQRQLHRKR